LKAGELASSVTLFWGKFVSAHIYLKRIVSADTYFRRISPATPDKEQLKQNMEIFSGIHFRLTFLFCTEIIKE
jgi:hypothetical protein